MPGKLFAFRKDYDMFRLACHIPYGLGPHLIPVRKAGSSGIPVSADKKIFHKEVFHTLTDHGSYQNLGILLINASQKHNLKV